MKKSSRKKPIKQIVKKFYDEVANSGGCCERCSCSAKNNKEISKSIGYSESETGELAEANLGLGCGNPTAMAKIKTGNTVVDLGSGAGFDAFLAAKRVGTRGKVIGVDFSKPMIAKAKSNAKKYGYKNTKFIYGDIEKLPLDDGIADIIISNCVINLSSSKEKVFKEINRVLMPTGRAYLSDIVLLKDLSEKERNDEKLIGGCVGNAILKDEYLKLIKKAGLKAQILDEDKQISKRQYRGIALESIKLELQKRTS